MKIEEEYVEGRNPVLEALRGSRRVYRVYISKTAVKSEILQEIEKAAAEDEIPVERVDPEDLEKLSSTRSPQGVVAHLSEYRYLQLKELMDSLAGIPAPLLIALDGVEDPQNMGSLLRVADAGGVDGIIIPNRRSCGVTAAVAKASAGAVEHVLIARVPNLVRAIDTLKKNRFWVTGAEAEGGKLYSEIDFTGPSVIVLGSEGKGIGRLIAENCDFLARLPMKGKVSSLNVAQAGAVLVYEALRQRESSEGN